MCIQESKQPHISETFGSLLHIQCHNMCVLSGGLELITSVFLLEGLTWNICALCLCMNACMMQLLEFEHTAIALSIASLQCGGQICAHYRIDSPWTKSLNVETFSACKLHIKQLVTINSLDYLSTLQKGRCRRQPRLVLSRISNLQLPTLQQQAWCTHSLQFIVQRASTREMCPATKRIVQGARNSRMLSMQWVACVARACSISHFFPYHFYQEWLVGQYGTSGVPGWQVDLVAIR